MKNSLKIFLSLLLTGCLICLWVKLGSVFLADFYSAKSEKALEEMDFARALKYSTKAIDLNPKEEAYFRRRAKVLILSSKEEALKDILFAIDLNPRSLATLRNTIPLMYLLSLQNPLEATVDLNYLSKTKEFYAYLFENYPNDVGILVSLAHYQKKLGLEEDLAQTLPRIKQLRPDLLEWHPLLLE